MGEHLKFLIKWVPGFKQQTYLINMYVLILGFTFYREKVTNANIVFEKVTHIFSGKMFPLLHSNSSMKNVEGHKWLVVEFPFYQELS